MFRTTMLGLLLAIPLGSCSEAANPKVQDLTGQAYTPLTSASDDVQVFIVTSQECPIANAYSPVIGELAQRWQGKPVELWIVHADPDFDATAAAEHARDYQLPGTVVLDPHHHLIAALQATRTPEAIVRRRGRIHYRGRIDDEWNAFGARGQEASVHDLRDAVDAVLAGKPVALATTEVIGCLLPEPRQ